MNYESKKFFSDQNLQLLNFIGFVFFALFGIYQGEITVFYFLYIFWWQELLDIIMDMVGITLGKTPFKVYEIPSRLFSRIFLMLIYLIFIVVFFGFILNLKQDKLIIINLEILFFKNVAFNFNLIFLFLTSLFYVITEKEIVVESFFSPRQIILHISIILGAALIFFTNFSPENKWGSLVVALPFFILRYIFDIYFKKSEN